MFDLKSCKTSAKFPGQWQHEDAAGSRVVFTSDGVGAADCTVWKGPARTEDGWAQLPHSTYVAGTAAEGNRKSMFTRVGEVSKPLLIFTYCCSHARWSANDDLTERRSLQELTVAWSGVCCWIILTCGWMYAISRTVRTGERWTQWEEVSLSFSILRLDVVHGCPKAKLEL